MNYEEGTIRLDGDQYHLAVDVAEEAGIVVQKGVNPKVVVALQESLERFDELYRKLA